MKVKPSRALVMGLAAIVIVGALALLLPVIGPSVIMPMMMGSVAPPTNLELSTTRVTENGLYQISYVPPEGGIRINQIHSWTLHVETADGQPLSGALIRVDGGMPQHGHGLPTRPEVTQDLGQGDYLAEGLKFQMPGWWEVRFEIVAGEQTDLVTFNLVLP